MFLNRENKSVEYSLNVLLGCCLVVLSLSFISCTSASFPSAPTGSGIRDVPYVPTYWFHFRTGTDHIGVFGTGTLGNLQIISGSDLLNLLAAANITQEDGNGIITGFVVDLNRKPLPNVVLDLRNTDGDSAGDLFYNSLGGIPDFSRSEGTTPTGVFTIFNAPPGIMFVTAVSGGRGSGRLFSFPDEVAFSSITVFPITQTGIGVTGQIYSLDGANPTEGVDIRILGSDKGTIATSAGARAFFRIDMPSNGSFVTEASKEGYIRTFQNLSTSLGGLQPGAPDLTVELRIGSMDVIEKWERESGTEIERNEDGSIKLGTIFGILRQSDGSPKHHGVVKVTDIDGNDIGEIFYIAGGRVNPSSSETGGVGQYVVFNVPPGPVFIKATGFNVTSASDIRFAGADEIFVRPGTLNVLFTTLSGLLPANEGSLAPWTTSMYGEVTDESGLKVIPDAEIFFLGTAGIIAKTRGNGSYFTPFLDVDVFEGVGVLAQSLYTAKVVADGYIDVYTDFRSGRYSSLRTFTVIKEDDLRLWAEQGGVSIETTLDNSGNEVIKGVLKGVIYDRKTGFPAKDITLTAKDEDGNDMGDIRYFDDDNIPILTEATSKFGKYIIFNVGTALVYLNVISCDDSGNMVVRSFDGGVKLSTFVINNAPNPTVKFSGAVNDLEGAKVGGASIAVLGSSIPVNVDIEEPDFCFASVSVDENENVVYGLYVFDVGADGNFNTKIPSDQDNVLRISKDGYMDTLHFDFITNKSDIGNEPLYITSEEQLDRLASEVGIVRDSSLGTIVGEVVGDGLIFQKNIPAKSPARIKLGLINADPDLDMVVLNRYDNTFTTYFGNGNGNFVLDDVYSTGIDPSDIELTRFTPDGLNDVIVVNKGSNNMYIFWGTRGGKFFLDQVHNTGLAPTGIVVQDYTRDGAADIIVSNAGSGAISAFVGDGVGGISGGAIFRQVGKSPSDIVTMDIDRDTFYDWAVSDSEALFDPFTGIYPEGIGVQFGNNADIIYLPSGERPSAIASGNFNRVYFLNGRFQQDRIRDIAVANEGSNDILVNLISFPNNILSIGITRIPLSISPISLLAVDINGDLNDDLIAGGIDSETGGGKVAIVLGVGDGTFHKPVYYNVGVSPFALAARELNGDTAIDLLVGSQDSDEIALFFNGKIPLGRITIQGNNMESEEVGDLFYMGDDGFVLQPERDSTSRSGRFIIFNVPPGLVNVSMRSGGTGNAIITSFSGAVSYVRINGLNIPPNIVGVQGTTGDAVGRPQGNVLVEYLGAGISTTSFMPETFEQRLAIGVYQVILPSNSQFLIRLTRESSLAAGLGAGGLGSGAGGTIVTRIGP